MEYIHLNPSAIGHAFLAFWPTSIKGVGGSCDRRTDLSAQLAQPREDYHPVFIVGDARNRQCSMALSLAPQARIQPKHITHERSVYSVK